MNFKSRILKLSLLLMLVLVLLPAIAAEDSSEAFFIEYSDESEEVVVEESDSIAEIEEDQNEVSVSSEVEEDIEETYSNTPVQDQSFEIEENDDAVIIPEQIDCSSVTHDIIDEGADEQVSNIYYENITDNNNKNDDIHEIDEELTIETISVNCQGSIFISKFDKIDDNLMLIHELNTGTTNYETHCCKRSLSKVLELKNDLLINQNVQFISADNIIDDEDSDIIVCADKITSDFVFSIDNSVIGDGNAIIFVTTSFCLNYTPCFDAFVCCDFFDECFSRGDFVIAAGFLVNFCGNVEFFG